MNKRSDHVLKIFKTINTIPRCSKNEKQIADWLVKWAEEHSFHVKKDSYNNVVIKIPSSKGLENLPGIIFQSHMDMVCEKNPDSTHDFCKDPIAFIIDGEWLHADQTTLGADDAIGMAMGMAVAEAQDIEHPELELLFTVDEETGLTGAKNLPSDFIRNKYLLNIDSDNIGSFTIGCAGGKDVSLSFPLSVEDQPGDNDYYSIEISGLKGGHSGVEINKLRGNANIYLVRALLYLLENKIPFSICSLEGGSAHNALPRNSSAILAFNKKNESGFLKSLNEFNEILKKEIKNFEPDFSIHYSKTESRQILITEDDSKRLVDFLNLLPHGIAGMSAEVENLVETSNNFATIRTLKTKGIIEILLSYRSSKPSHLDWVLSKIKSLANITGVSIEIGNGYPAWQPDINSKFLDICKKAYEHCYQKNPKIEVIHAGLECGIIGDKYPGMEMISCGVTIQNAHSPDERVNIPSIDHTFNFIIQLFKDWKELKWK